MIYQNERYDDWLPRLAKIKKVLVNYKEELLTYHKKQLSKSEADKMPDGTISCAADGNFLETLNLSSSGLWKFLCRKIQESKSIFFSVRTTIYRSTI